MTSAKRFLRMCWRVFLVFVDAIGWCAIRAIGIRAQQAAPLRTAFVKKAAQIIPQSIPVIEELLHCPRCTELLEDLGSYLVCNGCESAWTATPEGLAPGRIRKRKRRFEYSGAAITSRAICEELRN
jgi:hypothetical protein